MKKVITKPTEENTKVYIAIGKEDIPHIKKALGGKNIKEFKNPLELEIYNMAENNAEKTIYERTKHMTDFEKIEFFKKLTKEYLIEESLNGNKY